MNSVPFKSHTNELLKKDSILKVNDIIEIEKLLVVSDYKTSRLPCDFDESIYYQ